MFLDDEIEILRPDLPRGRFRSVLFDFDGTLSLIREGWPQVMIPMMVEVLRETGTTRNRRRADGGGRRIRHAAQRQADDLPDDPAGRRSAPPRRPAARSAGVQASLSRSADGSAFRAG